MNASLLFCRGPIPKFTLLECLLLQWVCLFYAFQLLTLHFTLFTCLSRAKNDSIFEQISIFLKKFYLLS